MNGLTVITHNNTEVVDSREVAEMIDKDHSNLMRDIRGYIEVLGSSSKLKTSDFFIESTFKQAGNGKENPCYLLTKQGCEMVANKMTGQKGILFTASYVQAFNQMEKKLASPMEQLSPQLQLLINMELNQKRMDAELQETKQQIESNKQELQGIRDVIMLNPNSWRSECNTMISKIAYSMGSTDYIKTIKDEIYQALNKRYAVDLEARRRNRRRRMAEEGICKSKRDKLNYLDIIAEDKKLIEGYIQIVKEMAIKNNVKWEEKKEEEK